jgi:hypothetical protein
VPHLARISKALGGRDWNVYALVSTIEVERHRKSNPRLPSWLGPSYHRALRQLLDIGLRDLAGTSDLLVLQSILAFVALAKGALKLGSLLSHLDDSEIDELLEERVGWSDLYEGA